MPKNHSKPFPWKCGQCRQRTVDLSTGLYTVEMEHDGRSYSVSVPDLEAPRCKECGELVLDDAANQRISEAFRQQLGLLTPEQIRSNRETLGMTQKQLASRLGIAEATLSRWETGGQIQQRAMDRLLRLFFALEEVRAALADDAHVGELGSMVAVTSVDAGTASWFVACLKSARQDDIDRATRISRLAGALDELPAETEAAAVEEFHRLVTLMLPAPKRSKRP